MDIGRRRLLRAAAGMGLTGFVGSHRTSRPGGESEAPTTQRWHLLTRSLLDRAMAGGRPDRLRVERAVSELADVQGRTLDPL